MGGQGKAWDVGRPDPFLAQGPCGGSGAFLAPGPCGCPDSEVVAKSYPFSLRGNAGENSDGELKRRDDGDGTDGDL